MPDEQEQIDENAQSIEMLLDIIKRLEKRIISLERRDSVVHIQPTDSYYWNHG